MLVRNPYNNPKYIQAMQANATLDHLKQQFTEFCATLECNCDEDAEAIKNVVRGLRQIQLLLPSSSDES